MSEWSFTLLINQPLTPEQADAFDHCDAFADGSVSYTLGPDNPEAYPHSPSAETLRQLSCDTEAPTLLDAVAQVARDVRLIPGLRAVGVRYDDMVTLEEAAQRCGRSHHELVELAKNRRGTGGFPQPESGGEGTEFYSWRKISAYLTHAGDALAAAPRDLVVADRALRLAEALEGADVSPGTLQSLGLPLA
ncbi:hypothetical protein CG747_38295 [Streptomyces sp. CB02959]|uniref:hypothetical protein n=1 Tax=Streptomyces sp. CB02959 TaxID=2020330 RepID=UPI000C273085|nr:hypothetical protein [Streptomyces sp. CB02959]PJN35490.1 hypothetical protein CG747_38295 [Streptomyces sp. CB02959]